MTTTLLTLSILLYLSAAALLLRRLLRRAGADGQPRKSLPLLLGLAGSVLHVVQLRLALSTPAGLDLSFFSVLSLSAWVVALLVLLASVRTPVENLGIVILPLTALCTGLQPLGVGDSDLFSHPSTGMEAHILLSILSYSLLSIAAVQSGVLALQNHQLRHRHPGGLIRGLPPLQTMESLLFQMIGAGFALLSLSLLTGALFMDDIFAQHLVHKTVLSIIAWLVFAVLLWGRWRFGWRGRTAVRWTLGGFGLLVLAYFGSKLVLELILSR